MKEIITNILSTDASILVPLIILVLALIMKMKLKDAIKSALLLAIAFTSISLLITFMFGTIGPVANDFVKSTNIKLNVLDLGFSPMVIFAFSWKFAVLIFPLQIGMNILMIHFKLTNVLNVDLFNVWGKIFIAALVHIATGSVILAFIAAIVQVILELKTAEKIKDRVVSITKIESTTCTNPAIIQSALIFPLDRILNRFKAIRESNLDVAHLKNRIGVFGDDAVMGLTVGFFLAFFARYPFVDSITIGVKLATCLVLLPIISKFFIDALNPVAGIAKKYMEDKYRGRDISIGLDWTILAAAQELWIVSIMLIPITLVFAIIFAKLGLSSILPLPGLVNIVVVVPALIICNRNILKMLLVATILTPVYLMVSTFFAPYITQLGNYGNQLISYYSLESPFFRWSITKFLQLRLEGILAIIAFIALYIYFYKNFEKEKNYVQN